MVKGRFGRFLEYRDYYTTALAPWQGGFYKHLVGLVKQGLRKGIGCKLLSWDKLLTKITEVEAVINTRPLTYCMCIVIFIRFYINTYSFFDS